jgi:hypothetical protein
MICDLVTMVQDTQIVRVVPGVFVRATLDAVRRKQREEQAAQAEGPSSSP